MANDKELKTAFANAFSAMCVNPVPEVTKTLKGIDGYVPDPKDWVAHAPYIRRLPRLGPVFMEDPPVLVDGNGKKYYHVLHEVTVDSDPVPEPTPPIIMQFQASMYPRPRFKRSLLQIELGFAQSGIMGMRSHHDQIYLDRLYRSWMESFEKPYTTTKHGIQFTGRRLVSDEARGYQMSASFVVKDDPMSKMIEDWTNYVYAATQRGVCTELVARYLEAPPMRQTGKGNLLHPVNIDGKVHWLPKADKP